MDDDMRTFNRPILFGAVLAAMAVGALGPWLARMDRYQAVFVAAGAVSCALAAGLAVLPRLRPCLLVATVFPYCWLVVPSAYQLARQRAAWGDNAVMLDFHTTVKAQLVLLTGILALLTAYGVFNASRGAAQQDGRTLVRDPWDPRTRRTLALSATMGLIALLAVPLVAQAAGGLDALFTNRTDFNAALEAQGVQRTDGALQALLKVVPSGLATTAALCSLWVFRHEPRGSSARVVACAVAAMMFLALLVVANPFVYSRYVVLVAFGTFALALFRPTSARAAFCWLGAGLVAFLLAYPAAEVFRRASVTSSTAPLLASKDYDGFQQTANAVALVDAHGIDHGHHLVSGMLFFVPRALWEGKARPASIEVAEARGYWFTDLSLPLPAEAFLDLGWVGVVVVMALFGSLLAFLDRAWVRDSPWAVVCAYVAVAQVGLWRGPLGSLASVLGFTTACLVLVLLFAGWFRTTSDAQGGSDDARRPR